MLFRFSRVQLAKAFLGRQSSGLCVVDVQFAAAVLATDPTAGIQCANHGSRIRSAAADDDVILIFCESRSATPQSLAPSGKRLGLLLRCKILRPSAGEKKIRDRSSHLRISSLP